MPRSGSDPRGRAASTRSTWTSTESPRRRRRPEPSASSAVPSSLRLHQPRSRRTGRKPSKRSSPNWTKAPFSIRPTTSPPKLGGSRGSASASTRWRRNDRQTSSASRSICIASRSADELITPASSSSWAAVAGLVDPEPLEQRAVGDDVRVAPDRRGEVAIAGARQAGVADVPRRVVGLLQRAQHQHADGSPPARLAGDDARDLGDGVGGLLRGHLLGQRRRGDVEARQLLREERRRLRLGPLVHAVERRQAPVGEVPGHLLVREDHQHLDQAVRLRLLLVAHAGHVAVESNSKVGSNEPNSSESRRS